MEKNDGIRAHDEHASDYDREARETWWFGPKVLFGLCFEYVSPHERLLDIGIGTGLGSMPFANQCPQGYSEIMSDWSVPAFMHSRGYIEELLQGYGFLGLKEFKFLVRDLHEGVDDLACAYVTRRTVV